MSRSTSVALCLLLAAGAAGAQGQFQGVGRAATPAEIRAWDIDVRADFTGLPKGSGSVKKGEAVWDAKCASCHGAFGESNQTFPPLVGGTTTEDMAKGRVASLLNPEQGRSTLMKLAYMSTLWDYINRAMPWNASRTLTVEEVYAVSAYILYLGNIVSEDFVLSDGNIAEVQKRLPNRDGLTRVHGLWRVEGKPDVINTACTKDCPVEGKITSQLPDYARDTHGNVADQNRIVGPVRGLQTAAVTAGARSAAAEAPAGRSAKSLAEKTGCLACHGITGKLVGPGLTEVAARYRGDGGAQMKLAAKVKAGGSGIWGAIPMPPNAGLKDDEIGLLVQWILGGAK